VDAQGQAALLGGGKNAVVGGVAQWLARPLKGRNEEPRNTRLSHSTHLAFRRFWISQGNLGHREKSVARVRAKIHNPSVVGTQTSLGQVFVLALGYPKEGQRRVKKSPFDIFQIQALDALPRIHRTQRGLIDIFQSGDDFTFEDVTRYAIHRSQARRHSASDDFGNRAIDFEKLQSGVIGPDRWRPVAITGFEVLEPEIRRLEDMSITVHSTGE
jgi:hypothetical protein